MYSVWPWAFVTTLPSFVLSTFTTAVDSLPAVAVTTPSASAQPATKVRSFSRRIEFASFGRRDLPREESTRLQPERFW